MTAVFSDTNYDQWCEKFEKKYNVSSEVTEAFIFFLDYLKITRTE